MRIFKYHNKCSLASIILISILLILPSCRNIREYGLFGRRSLKNALLWAQQDSIRVADSLKNTLIVRDLAEEVFQDSIVLSEEEMLSEEGIRNQYYIIIGTFAKPDNAMNLAVQFRNQGYEASIIRTTNSYGTELHMVSVKTFKNNEEAISYLNEFQSEVQSPAWKYHSK